MVWFHDLTNCISPFGVWLDIGITALNVFGQLRPMFLYVAKQLQHVVIAVADGQRDVALLEGKECLKIEDVSLIG